MQARLEKDHIYELMIIDTISIVKCIDDNNGIKIIMGKDYRSKDIIFYFFIGTFNNGSVYLIREL